MAAKVREVVPGIYQVHLPLPMRPSIVNVYLINGKGEWALVDTGMNTVDSVATWKSALEQVGCAPANISKIIATHHHPDHFGTSSSLKEMTGAEIYLHPLEVERANRMASGPSSESLAFFRSHGVPVPEVGEGPSSPPRTFGSLYAPGRPDRFFHDGDILRVGSREIQVVWTPGHTPGHCCLFLPTEKILIVGDHLLPKITPHIGVYPGGPDNPLGDFIGSLKKVEKLDVKLVLPAHGSVYGDHRYRARQLIQHHDYRKMEILDVVRSRPHTSYQVAGQIFDFGQDSLFFHTIAATVETLAHLELLVREDKVRKFEQDGKIYFLGK